MMGRPPSQMQDKFIIRFPDGMRERIKAAADTNGRTMTAEIVWRLEKSLSGVEARLDDHERHIGEFSDLAYQSDEHGWELNGEVMILKGFCRRVADKLGIEPPSEDDMETVSRAKSA